MRAELLHGSGATLARCQLAPGETLLAEAGALVAATANVFASPVAPGRLEGVRRLLGAGSPSRTSLVTLTEAGEALLAPALPGDVARLEVGGSRWILAGSSYLANDPSVTIAPFLRSHPASSLPGMFLLEASGTGDLLVSGHGGLEAVELAGSLVLDAAHLVAHPASLRCSAEREGQGMYSWLLGTEGLACRLEGRGTVWLSARDPGAFGEELGALLPPRPG